MATHVSNAPQVNGVQSSPAEEEELYNQLLRLRDAVIAGTHPQLKLPAAVIESLKAQRQASTAAEQPAVNGVVNNDAAFFTNATTNNTQQNVAPSFPGLPGLQAPNRSLVNNTVPPTLKPSSSGTLDPIFLEKSDSLVRAEGQLKRQRIERELQTQLEQRKALHRDRDPGGDAPMALDIEAILANASAREPHVSGLEPAKAATPASHSSFDTNDYYSSQVESDWSSPQSASKGSDRAAGAFPADVEPREAPKAKASVANQAGQNSKDPTVHVNSLQFDGFLEVDDDDDEYDPAHAIAAFGSVPNGTAAIVGGQITPPDDDDDSEYEPGEITQDSPVPTPYDQGQQPAQPSPRVPVIRNHLTHIAAPQPNRVSPLAVAKRSSLDAVHELELVNGRPEVVQKGRPNHNAAQSRPSSGSPPVGGSGKKRQKKKRKRDQETSNRNNKKSRRERHAAAQSPPSPAHQQPYIKDEPISPPPFANVPEVQPYGQRASRYQPAEIDLVSPRHVPPPVQYAHEAPRSGLRYEYAAPASPAGVRVASPAYRPVHRDTQDLRRVASLHYAQRPPSPAQRTYSPAPTRTVSMTSGDPRLAKPAGADPYQDPIPQETALYVRRERSRSPPRLQEYHDPYARASSPAMMPPPAAPPRQIVVDQYGNRYYAAEPVPAPRQPAPMASVAPVERLPTMEVGYERAPSRMATSYAQPTPVSQYDPRRPDDRPVQYVDASGYRVRDYEPTGSHPRYVEAPTSPSFQPAPPARYETMVPPPPRKPTSPVYAPVKSYSMRPEEAAPLPTPTAYAPRQASVAPAPYARQELSAFPPAPTRAMSVMPGYEQPAAAPRAYSHAPPQTRYVDQYGREVYPSEVRQVPEYRYQ